MKAYTFLNVADRKSSRPFVQELNKVAFNKGFSLESLVLISHATWLGDLKDLIQAESLDSLFIRHEIENYCRRENLYFNIATCCFYSKEVIEKKKVGLSSDVLNTLANLYEEHTGVRVLRVSYAPTLAEISIDASRDKLKLTNYFASYVHNLKQSL